MWETSTGRCLRSIALGAGVCRVCWSPAAGLALLAAASGARLLLLSPGADVGAHRVAARTDRLLDEPPPHHDQTSQYRPGACEATVSHSHRPTARPIPCLYFQWTSERSRASSGTK